MANGGSGSEVGGLVFMLIILIVLLVVGFLLLVGDVQRKIASVNGACVRDIDDPNKCSCDLLTSQDACLGDGGVFFYGQKDCSGLCK